jgi:surfeit locus 1 family protein
LLLVALAVGATCLRLGFLQLDRLSERRQANTEIRANPSTPPISLNSAEAVTASDAFRSAESLGTLDLEHHAVLSTRSLNGQPGMRPVLPLRLQSRTDAILVDRGWLPLSETEPERLTDPPSSATSEVRGVLLPPQVEPRWGFVAGRLPDPGQPPHSAGRVLSIPGIQAQTLCSPLPMYLAACVPAPDPALPKPDIALDLSEGPHLSQAIRGFAFCAIPWIEASADARRRLGMIEHRP